MEILIQLFGQGHDLSLLQMVVRGIVTFIVALLLIRISGRRSFGIRTPLDNIITILLGAILSRGVVGASPYIPIVCSCLAIVILHRIFGWLLVHNEKIAALVEGKRIPLFKNGQFQHSQMKKGLVCEEDIMQGVRKSALTENLEKIETVYMERNGEITAIEKEKE